MYDPMTVAFEIRSPFKKPTHWNKDHRELLVTIWHNDPALRGDDDSCGWAYVNLSREDEAWAEARAKEEWGFWFSDKYDGINMSQAGSLEVLGLCWNEVRFRAGGLPRHKDLTPWDIAQIFGLLACPGDNFGWAIRRAKKDAEGLAELLMLTLRVYKTRRRPWYKKPRWHIHHWSFQVHPLQRFNRWAFSRCSRCGGRFKWGYCPVSGSWNGGGPRFLRGEKNIWHMECDRQHAPSASVGVRHGSL